MEGHPFSVSSFFSELLGLGPWIQNVDFQGRASEGMWLLPLGRKVGTHLQRMGEKFQVCLLGTHGASFPRVWKKTTWWK